MMRDHARCHAGADRHIPPILVERLCVPSKHNRRSHARHLPATVRQQQRALHVLCATIGEERATTGYLSDMIAFESERAGATQDPQEVQPASRSVDATDDVIASASAALAAARQALENKRQREPSRPKPSQDYSRTSSSKRDTRQRSDDATRATLEQALGRLGASGEWDSTATTSSYDSQNSQPPWAQSPSASAAEPQLQRQQQAQTQTQTVLPFAERAFTFVDLPSQAAEDLAQSRSATLPPLQSVLELTSAAAPPSRGILEASTVSQAGQVMEDGQGQLADGTRYERTTTEEFGPDGYWLRQTVLRGVSDAGKVEWEERWWEVSDWAGMREMGAEKSGCAADGSAWRETWREMIGFDQASGQPIVERSAHKWAHDAKGDEWEEKWGENYTAKGQCNKWADKWGKDGPNVWHERWGEDYDGGGGCVKYTDKWAEKLVEGGGIERWGENWVEDFGDGKGSKKGETWSVDPSDHRYQRWWGEEHFGNGWVRKFGNSTTGEHWDTSEYMDTYYNPIPHFTYQMALDHSPTLKNVPTLPRGGLDEIEEGGIGAL